MSYVLAGYGITVAGVAAYALRVVVRGRALRRRFADQAPQPDAGGSRP